MTYEISVHKKYFSPLLFGTKTFDFRRNDKGYKVGDTIRYREYDDILGSYTGRECKREVTYVYEGQGNYGLAKGYAILALKIITEDKNL